MNKTLQLSAKQSKRARSLLHWNVQDISSRCNITRVRIEQFERGDVPLTRIENELLLKVFIKNGILINTHGDVLMREDAKDITEQLEQKDNVFAVNTQSYSSENLTQQRAEEDEEARTRKLDAEKNPAPRN